MRNETAGPPEVAPRSLAETLRLLEQRLQALEEWRAGLDARTAGETAPLQKEAVSVEPSPAGEERVILEETDSGFDLSIIGRALIILGGAFLLRALTDGGFFPVSVGIALGLLYALTWSLLALRTTTTDATAIANGVTTSLIALPLVFEGVRKFHVLGPWSAAFALSAVSVVVFTLVCRRRLESLAWTFSLMALLVAPLMMLQTEQMVPFVLYLTALGITTLWLGYEFEWTMLRWVVAIEADVALYVMAFLVATNRLPELEPSIAIATGCVAFAAYLASFAVRTLVRQREALPFEIAQTLLLLLAALGGSMWVAASRSTLEVTLAVAMIALAGFSYAVSFAFIPHHFVTPRNFVFYSSLGLMMIVAGSALITRGLPSSALFAALAGVSGYLAVHFRKSSLALHAAVYLFAGFAGADLIRLAFRSLVMRVESGWPVPAEGTALLLLATIGVAWIRPIERQGTFELWTAAKVIALAELGWIGSSLFMTALGSLYLSDATPDRAVVAVARTAVIAALPVAAAWASRFPRFSPGRLLCNPLLVVLGLKLVWEDFRVGRPATLFISLAIVGAALILTQKLRRAAHPPEAHHAASASTTMAHAT